MKMYKKGYASTFAERTYSQRLANMHNLRIPATSNTLHFAVHSSYLL